MQNQKVIVTDRLHGLIFFALITNTPCIVISSYNQKLKEFTDMLKR
ncbi:MAG: polysaccharide pyruvyl transferase family protein [Clostridium sp.]|nr:MAG: polysaccharide pyruvyl transferase family protein [Clostridium sp.]